jgi:hypothetical protein
MLNTKVKWRRVMDDPLVITENIWDLIRSGNCVAWIGSGFSEPLYPKWENLINDLCSSCGETYLSTDDPHELINKAQECKNNNLDAYKEVLYRHFAREIDIPIRYLNITRLPFQGYITTNYDPLLAYAAHQHNSRQECFYYPDLPIHRLGEEKPVYYIHGGILPDDKNNPDKPLNIVLCRNEFEEAYGGMTKSFLIQLFAYRNILFLGCRLKEPEIELTLRKVHDIQEEIKVIFGSEIKMPHKIIFLPAQIVITEGQEQINLDNEHDEEERLNELDFEIVRYNPKDEHSELYFIIENICKKAAITFRPHRSLGIEESEVHL